MGLATGFDDDSGSDWLLMESWYVSSMMATAGGTATEDAQSRWSSSRGTIFGKMITENRAAEEMFFN